MYSCTQRLLTPSPTTTTGETHFLKKTHMCTHFDLVSTHVLFYDNNQSVLSTYIRTH
jgi:hypothetical protein